jgi:hypothetical protein
VLGEDLLKISSISFVDDYTGISDFLPKMVREAGVYLNAK